MVHKIFLGTCAGNTNNSGNCNIAIGFDVELPSATGDNQFAIGSGTNRWIYGDRNYNIYDKDGNQLNGASSGGFSADADLKLLPSKLVLVVLNGSSSC